MATISIVEGTEYLWTLSPHDVITEMTPRINMTQYRQTASNILQSAAFWSNALNKTVADITSRSAAPSNPYEGMYVAAKQDEYQFPFFSEYHHTINNSWNENRGPLENAVDATLVQASKLTRPSAGIEPPRQWEGVQTASYSFSFRLYNKTDEYITAHRAFIDRFVRANLQYRTSPTNAIPPAIYEVYIPGIRYSPASTITSLQVTNVGQMHYIKEIGNVPDAYQIDVAITELIGESINIYADVDPVKGQRIRAIISSKEATKALANLPLFPDAVAGVIGKLGTIDSVNIATNAGNL